MAVPTFKDELDDLPATKVTTSKTVAVEDDDEKASMKAKVSSEEIEDLSVDFGDRELMKQTGLLERLRPEKGKAVRFAFLTDFVKAKSAFTHFIDKKGTFRCLEDKKKRTPKDKGGDPDAQGYCCKKLGEDAERMFVALVFYYKNAEPTEGGLEKGSPIDWEIRYVQLSRANFISCSRLIKEEITLPDGKTREGTINDMDIVMMHTNKAFGYEFHEKAARPRWRQAAQLVEEVTEKLKPFMDGVKLDTRLGRKVTELEMKALVASLGPGAEDARLGDVEKL
jgi:hypothetical protein